MSAVSRFYRYRHLASARGASANPANLANLRSGSSRLAGLAALAGVPPVNLTSDIWLDGVAGLRPARTPDGLTAMESTVLIRDVKAFRAEHSAIATELRWSVLDCFGADPDRPERGYAAAGLVALLRGEWTVARLHEDRAELVSKATGARQTFYCAASANGARPVWEWSDARASDDGGRAEVFLK